MKQRIKILKEAITLFKAKHWEKLLKKIIKYAQLIEFKIIVFNAEAELVKQSFIRFYIELLLYYVNITKIRKGNGY